ncbi:hypothetical protein K474DRAFT_1656791 [Panus rudis PR-1116 ss-1]|nr:hypothetical protein K474DRAFT_1656791 [Panus rudis PR-1116 ss-1]
MPAAPSTDSLVASSSSSSSIASVELGHFRLPRHTDVLRYRFVDRDAAIPITPTRLTDEQANLQLGALTGKLNLINHDVSLHMYKPLSELKKAIRIENKALSLATIPNGVPETFMKKLKVPSLGYGMDAKTFLDMYRSKQTRLTYAEIVRVNAPPITHLSIDTPQAQPQLIYGPAPPPGFVIEVNSKSRSHQDKAEVGVNEAETVRQKAAMMDSAPLETHPNVRARRNARFAAARERTVSGESSEFPTEWLKDSPSPSPSPAPSAEPRRRTTSDSALHTKWRSNSAEETKTPEVPSVVPPQSQDPISEPQSQPPLSRSASVDSGKQHHRRKPTPRKPTLETIIGSPPDSPPTVRHRGRGRISTRGPNGQPSLGQVLQESFGFPVNESDAAKATDFARVDDEDALEKYETQEQEQERFGASTPALGAGASGSRSGSRRPSVSRGPWRP